MSYADTYSRTDIVGNQTPPRFDSQEFSSPFTNKNFPSEMISPSKKLKKDKSTKSLLPRYSDHQGRVYYVEYKSGALSE